MKRVVAGLMVQTLIDTQHPEPHPLQRLKARPPRWPDLECLQTINPSRCTKIKAIIVSLQNTSRQTQLQTSPCPPPPRGGDRSHRGLPGSLRTHASGGEKRLTPPAAARREPILREMLRVWSFGGGSVPGSRVRAFTLANGLSCHVEWNSQLPLLCLTRTAAVQGAPGPDS